MRILYITLAVVFASIYFYKKFEITLNGHDFSIVNRKSSNCVGAYWCYTSGYPTNTTYTFANNIWFYHYGGSVWKD